MRRLPPLPPPPQVGQGKPYQMKDLGYERTACQLVLELIVRERVFRVPAQVVIDDRDEHYKDDEEDTWGTGDEDDILEWAQNNMNWSDVAAWAYEIPAPPVGPDHEDFQAAWMGHEGSIEILEI